MCFLSKLACAERVCGRSRPLHGGRQTSSERGRRNKGASARTCLHGSRRHHQQARLSPRTPDRLGVRDEGLAPVLPGLAAAPAHHLPHLRTRLVGRGSVGTQAFRCWSPSEPLRHPQCASCCEAYQSAPSRPDSVPIRYPTGPFPSFCAGARGIHVATKSPSGGAYIGVTSTDTVRSAPLRPR